MRKFLSNIGLMAGLACVCAVSAVSCSDGKSEMLYQGPSFVQFADSAYLVPVTCVDTVFQIPVSVARASRKDRSIAVVTDLRQSNAIEGYHYRLESHNVLIPAGETVGYLRVCGYFGNIESVSDSLCATFRLLVPGDEVSSMYGNSVNVRFQKVLPFCIDDYVGDLRVTCTFPYSTSSVTSYLVKSEKVDSVTLRIKSLFDNVRDITVRFRYDPSNPFEQGIDVPEQIAFTDNVYGPVSMAAVEGIPSYYLPEDRAFVLYMEAFLAQMGSFGAFYYVFEWVTPDQALAEKNGLNTIY